MAKPKKTLPDWIMSLPDSSASTSGAPKGDEDASAEDPEDKAARARYWEESAERASVARFRSGGEFLKVVSERGNSLMGVSPMGIEIGIHPRTMVASGPRIPWEDVADVEVTGPESVQRRVTATRAIAFGALALAMQKAEASVVIAVTRADGRLYECATSEAGAAEIQRRINRFRKAAASVQGESEDSGQDAPQRGAGVEGVEERLVKLDTLKAKGLVTENEYREQRARILDSL